MSIASAGKTIALTALGAAVSTVALFVGDPETTGVEVSGGSYARASSVAWTVRSDTLTNPNPIVWAKPTASWGAVTHYAAYDGSGNRIFSGALNRTVTLDSTTPALVLGAGTAFLRLT